MKQNRHNRIMLFLITCMITFSMLFAVSASAKDVVIVIDPGHGGTESGAARAGLKEEVINQKISNYLKAELLAYSGIKVYMTRTSLGQKAMDREERVNVAKVKKADALISIHINSTGADSQTSATGAFAAVPSSKFTSESAQTSRALASSILKSLYTKAGVKNNGYWIDDELGIILYGQKKNYTTAQANKLGIARSVLNRQVPSMIIEHAFINNPNDRSKYLSSNAKLKKLAIGDADGIAKYFKLKKSGSEPAPGPVYKGLVQIDGKRYLFDKYGEPREGLVKYGGKYYYAYGDGELATGWMKIGTKRYYFKKKDCQGHEGFHKVGSYKYFFKNGYCLTKWVNINGLDYYFSKANGRLLTNYWLKWEGNWYYLNEKGTPWKSCRKVIDGVKYKFNAKGICTNKQ